MNISRAFASIPSTKRSLLCSFSLFQSSNLSSAASTRTKYARKPKFEPRSPEPDPLRFPDADAAVAPATKPPPDPSDWPRPAEIQWQPQVANSVHLIGCVAFPVQLDVAPDGRYWAVSILRQQKKTDFPQLWIPIVFEGDLAQIAACHLRENDLIYVNGQISGEPPHSTIEQRQTSIQVMVQNVSFIQKNCMVKKPLEQNELASDCSGNAEKNAENGESLWQDLIINPKHWRDHRLDKKNGSVKPRFPDFKHKVTGKALWLVDAPKWIQLKLKEVEFDVKDIYPKQESDMPPMKAMAGGKSVQQYSGANKTIGKESKESNSVKKSCKVDRADVSWKDLLENPDNWWDNRSTKFNPKYPDFKHKVTGEALWITSSSTPSWVLTNLPPMTPKQEIDVMMGNTH